MWSIRRRFVRYECDLPRETEMQIWTILARPSMICVAIVAKERAVTLADEEGDGERVGYRWRA
jgi:hypothetical protein